MVKFVLLFMTILLLGVLTISARYVLHSVFALIGAYFVSVWALCLLDCEFLAFVILIVYLGALAVLFLFVIMTIPEMSVERDEGFVNLGIVIGFILLGGWIINSVQVSILEEILCLNSQVSLSVYWWDNVEVLGVLLYYYNFPVSVFCGLLLVTSVICILRIIK